MRQQLRTDYSKHKINELRNMAEEAGISAEDLLTKLGLVDKLVSAQYQPPTPSGEVSKRLF